MALEFRFRESSEGAYYQLRELLRGNKHRPMPNGRAGFVVEDIDLVLRWKGPSFNLDEGGRIRLLEMKGPNYRHLGTAQAYTFGLLAHLMGPPNPQDWDGFYIVQSDDDNHNTDTRYRINYGSWIDEPEFVEWCLTPHSTVPAMKTRRLPNGVVALTPPHLEGI